MSLRRGTWSTSFLLALLAVACTSATGPDVLITELDRAEALWLERRPETYEAVASRECECLPSESGPLRLHVARTTSGTEQIVGGSYVGSGELAPPEVLALFRTVTGLFDTVRSAIEAGAHDVRLDYDDELGYPREVDIDIDRRTADDEIGYRFEVVSAGG